MMHIRTSLQKLFLITLFLLAGWQSYASRFSYVYIQGDKQTPFYVKFEDEMLPRYGKNYCIISQLAPGPIRIQVLFQQNAYPAQSFTIQVPENGFRGFLLTRTETGFALFDINQQFYLQADNKAEDDHIPADIQETPPAVVNTPVETPAGNAPEVSEEVPVNTEEVTNIAALEAVETETSTPPPATAATSAPVTTPPVASNSPQFMNDIELGNEKNRQDNNTIAVENTSYHRPRVAIVNSDCPKAVDNDLFEAILKKANDKTEKTRLKYLLAKVDGNCYTTNQVRILTITLTNDPEKYTFLKAIYSRITDQSKFPSLERLLSSEEWKNYFRLIIP